MQGSYRIGNIHVKYVDKSDLDRYENLYYSIKQISIEDLFIIRGVDLES